MKIVSVGGGPAGLYFAILMKQANPDHDMVVYERNRLEDTFGFGVVFSDATGGNLATADPVTFREMERHSAKWDDIAIHYGGEVIVSTGHGFSGMSRWTLLKILADRCRDLGVDLRFESEVTDLSLFGDADLILAADGFNSGIRTEYRKAFRPQIEFRPNRFVWLGTTPPFPAFTFYFKVDTHGLWRVHAYQYEEGHSTFIVEATEETWQASGLGESDEDATVAYFERLFAEELEGHRLLKNKSLWRRFPNISNRSWHHDNIVLMGDAAHTAHFSVGSGTKLAMEDGIALAEALAAAPDIATALVAYEAARRPPVESLQRAAQVSLEWFENAERYMALDPIQFAFNLLTRSLRVSHENLKLRDPAFVDRVDRWFAGVAAAQSVAVVPTDPLAFWYREPGLIVEAGGGVLEAPERWGELCRRVNPQRSLATILGRPLPPRAVVACVSCEHFAESKNDGAVTALAETLRARINELSTHLGVTIPVYVMFTKADTVPFFDDFIRRWPRSNEQEVFGSTLATPAGSDAKPYEPDRIQQRLTHLLEGLVQSLSSRRTDLLRLETESMAIRGVYEFPREFGKRTPLFARFLQELTRPGQIPPHPFLRGFYFTGRRQGDAQDEAGGAVWGGEPARAASATALFDTRSEERRVGKECRSPWSPHH